MDGWDGMGWDGRKPASERAMKAKGDSEVCYSETDMGLGYRV